MTLWIKIAIIFTIVIILLFIIVYITKYLHHSENEKLQKALTNKSLTRTILKVDYNSLKDLPTPVQKYFRNVLTHGQSFIKTSWLKQNGQLRISPKSKRWLPFKASQTISEDKISFLWDAKINLTPLLYVQVRDLLINGIGSGDIYFMSVLPIGSDKNKSELNSGALYRYLAEAVWHPTALLPQSGVIWKEVSETKAMAYFTKFNISISVEFTFNSNNEIIGVYTKNRYGKFSNKYIKFPWEGRFSDYKEFDGIKIPTKGEVGWHLPTGWWLFWKGQIINAKFEL